MISRPPVLLIGATSDIGRAIARAFAARAHFLHLAARDPARLAAEAEDLRLRAGSDAACHCLDILALPDLDAWLAALRPPPGIVVCTVGLLADNRQATGDPRLAERIMRTNYVGPALVLEAAARRLADAEGGTIVGIGSVAGDRGRAGNYVYGSAKAGLDAYLSGLRARLHRQGVRVVTVKPGFVDTRMTAGMSLPPLLTARPEEVAEVVVRACGGGPEVIYVRPLWRWIMTLIRWLPEPLFKRLGL